MVDSANRPGNGLPQVFPDQAPTDLGRYHPLFSYQNTVEECYAGDIRIYAKKFGDYLSTSKSKVYDPKRNEFIDLPIRYATPQLAFADNLPTGSTGAVPEASLTDRVALPLISYYLTDMKRDDSRAVDRVVRHRVRPLQEPDGKILYNTAITTAAPIPIDYQFQVDIWTEYREHYYQLLTAFHHDFNPYSYLTDVYDIEDDTQKLVYTPYVPMFLDSVTDNSNFVIGSDRRITRGTIRITVKGWMTPALHTTPYVHNVVADVN